MKQDVYTVEVGARVKILPKRTVPPKYRGRTGQISGLHDGTPKPVAVTFREGSTWIFDYSEIEPLDHKKTPQTKVRVK